MLTLMVFLVALSNYTVQFPINDWLTWGAFIYPLTFLISEVVNRNDGPNEAKRIVWVGFMTAIVISFLISDWRIAAASCTAFLISQLLDISIFNKMRSSTWWKAPFVASLLATWIDTWIFFGLAFYGKPFPWVTIALGDFLIKFSIDILCLLPFRLLIVRKSIT